MWKSKTVEIVDESDTDDGGMHSKELYVKTAGGASLMDNCKLLIQAVKQGNESIVVKLLNAGVPSYICDQLGCNPFFYAARYNHINILKILLSSGTLINVITKMERTALQIAAYHGHKECVQFLLENGANVNLVDSLGMSALHWASENGHADCVKLLLKAGADPSVMNKFGKTAFALALKKNRYEIWEMLRERVKSVKSTSEFLLTSDLINQEDKSFRPFTAVYIPADKNSLFSDQKVPSLGSFLSAESEGENDQSKLTFKSNAKKDDTIRLFEQHGIKLLPVDQSTIIASALKRGQTAVLTEAGKLALKKTEPNIIRKIAGMSNNNLNTPPPTKKFRTEKEDKNGTDSESIKNSTSSVKIDEVDISNLNKAKIIKIDAKQLVNLTANKKLIISRPKRVDSSPINEIITQVENLNQITIPARKRNDESCSKSTKELQNQLKKKNNQLRDMKKQLDVTFQLAKHYKSRYEVKEREAALYKTQLSNLTKIMMKSGIRISKMQS